MSTVAPETSRRLYRAAREFGIPVLDVAVSGSTSAADAGALTLLGGGEPRTFELSTPIFAPIGQISGFTWAPAVPGVAMKLVVNTLLGLGMQAVAEAAANSPKAWPATRSPFRDFGKNGGHRAGTYGETGNGPAKTITRRNFPCG